MFSPRNNIRNILVLIIIIGLVGIGFLRTLTSVNGTSANDPDNNLPWCPEPLVGTPTNINEGATAVPNANAQAVCKLRPPATALPERPTGIGATLPGPTVSP